MTPIKQLRQWAQTIFWIPIPGCKTNLKGEENKHAEAQEGEDTAEDLSLPVDPSSPFHLWLQSHFAPKSILWGRKGVKRTERDQTVQSGTKRNGSTQWAIYQRWRQHNKMPTMGLRYIYGRVYVPSGELELYTAHLPNTAQNRTWRNNQYSKKQNLDVPINVYVNSLNKN